MPGTAAKRAAVAATCPARVTPSSMRGLSQTRYAAFVAAQSWHATGIVPPIRSPKWPSNRPQASLQPPVRELGGGQFAFHPGIHACTPDR